MEILSEGSAPCLASSHDDPVEGIRRWRPDLIVIDVGWGTAMDDRIEKIRLLRADEYLSSVPLVAVTTDRIAAHRHRAQLKQLSVRVVMLPVDLDTFEARIGGIVAV